MARFTEIRYLRVLVQLGADTVTLILAHDRKAVALDVFLYRVSDVGDAVAGLGELDTLEEALPRHLDEPLCLLAYLAAGIGPRAVAVEAVYLCSYVHAHDIAAADRPRAGDAVYDLLVHGDTGAARESSVVQEGRGRSGAQYEFVDFPVDLTRGHAGRDGLACHGARERRYPAGFAHEFDLTRGLDYYHSSIPSVLAISAVVASMVAWLFTDLSLPRSA